MHPLEPFKYCPRCGSVHFSDSSVKSKLCAKCHFELFMNSSASTAAFIINGDGSLLVVKRKNEPAKGTLDLPGGFIDIGETAEEGLTREVLEETGLHVTGTEYLFSLPNIYPFSGLNIYTTDLFFRCEVADTEALRFADDVETGYWIPIKELNASDFGLSSIRKAVACFQQRTIHEILKK